MTKSPSHTLYASAHDEHGNGQRSHSQQTLSCTQTLSLHFPPGFFLQQCHFNLHTSVGTEPFLGKLVEVSQSQLWHQCPCYFLFRGCVSEEVRRDPGKKAGFFCMTVGQPFVGGNSKHAMAKVLFPFQTFHIPLPLGAQQPGFNQQWGMVCCCKKVSLALKTYKSWSSSSLFLIFC